MQQAVPVDPPSVLLAPCHQQVSPLKFAKSQMQSKASNEVQVPVQEPVGHQALPKSGVNTQVSSSVQHTPQLMQLMDPDLQEMMNNMMEAANAATNAAEAAVASVATSVATIAATTAVAKATRSMSAMRKPIVINSIIVQ